MRQNWSWHGVAGIILAGSLGLGWAISLVVTALQQGPVTAAGAQLLNTIGGAIGGSVATWIGLAGGKKPHDPDLNERSSTTTTTITEEESHGADRE